VLGPDRQATVLQVALTLFHSAISDAVSDLEYDAAHRIDVDLGTLIARARGLWYEAIQTSELLLMKTAIRANFADLHSTVRLPGAISSPTHRTQRTQRACVKF